MGDELVTTKKTEEELLSFEPLMMYTRTEIDANKQVEKMWNHQPLLDLHTQAHRKPPEPPDFPKFDGTKLHEWMERCERLFSSIMMIHSLRQHATYILSHYGSKNSMVLKQWRQQGNKLNPSLVRGISQKLCHISQKLHTCISFHTQLQTEYHIREDICL